MGLVSAQPILPPIPDRPVTPNVRLAFPTGRANLAAMSDDTVRPSDVTFTEFPPARREQWLALVSSVIKGAPFERRLVSRSYDGIAIAPLYQRDHGARAVFGRTAAAPWRVVQRIEFADPAAANVQALHDLENGATGLSLVFTGTIGAYGFGLDR